MSISIYNQCNDINEEKISRSWFVFKKFTKNIFLKTSVACRNICNRSHVIIVTDLCMPCKPPWLNRMMSWKNLFFTFFLENKANCLFEVVLLLADIYKFGYIVDILNATLSLDLHISFICTTYLYKSSLFIL